MAGHKCEVYAVHAVAVGKGKAFTDIKVKDADEPLQIDKLAFILSHPSMLRRLMFAVEKHEPFSIRQSFGFCRGDGYGSPVEHPMAGTIVLGCANIRDDYWRPVDRARAWVHYRMREQGVRMDAQVVR